MIRVRQAAAGAVAALLMAGLAASVAGAAVKTTEPGKTILVYFIFTDKKLLVGVYREAPGGGTSNLYLGTPPTRGDYAIFYVVNRGHRTHRLLFLKKTFTVKPGQKDRFSHALLARGGFPYSSPSNPGKAFSGIFRVQ